MSDKALVPVYARDWMKQHGGPFLARLAGLYEVADSVQRGILLQAFEQEFVDATNQALDAPKEGR